MRIIHFVSNYIPELGYEINYVAHEHVYAGHEVLIHTTNILPSEKVGALIDNRSTFNDPSGLKVNRVRSLRVREKVLYLSDTIGVLKRFRPDVVHCHDIFSFTALAIAMMSRFQNFGLLFCNHAASFNTKASGLRRVAYTAIRVVLLRLLGKKRACWQAVGENEQVFLERLLGLSKAQVIINRLPVPAEFFITHAEDRQRIRKELGFGADDFVMIHAGTLAERKQIGNLLSVLDGIHRDGKLPRLRLFLVGSGKMAYIKHIRDEILKLGLGEFVLFESSFVPKDRLVEFFTASDVAVWPGDISIAALEALASGLALIARSDAYTRAITEWGNGILFNPGRDGELIAAINRLRFSPEERREMGKIGTAWAREELKSDVVGRRTMAIYRECMALRSPRSTRSKS